MGLVVACLLSYVDLLLRITFAYVDFTLSVPLQL
jgi:hypothetical protein